MGPPLNSAFLVRRGGLVGGTTKLSLLVKEARISGGAHYFEVYVHVDRSWRMVALTKSPGHGSQAANGQEMPSTGENLLGTAY